MKLSEQFKQSDNEIRQTVQEDYSRKTEQPLQSQTFIGQSSPSNPNLQFSQLTPIQKNNDQQSQNSRTRDNAVQKSRNLIVKSASTHLKIQSGSMICNSDQIKDFQINQPLTTRNNKNSDHEINITQNGFNYYTSFIKNSDKLIQKNMNYHLLNTNNVENNQIPIQSKTQNNFERINYLCQTQNKFLIPKQENDSDKIQKQRHHNTSSKKLTIQGKEDLNNNTNSCTYINFIVNDKSPSIVRYRNFSDHLSNIQKSHKQVEVNPQQYMTVSQQLDDKEEFFNKSQNIGNTSIITPIKYNNLFQRSNSTQKNSHNLYDAKQNLIDFKDYIIASQKELSQNIKFVKKHPMRSNYIVKQNNGSESKSRNKTQHLSNQSQSPQQLNSQKKLYKQEFIQNNAFQININQPKSIIKLSGGQFSSQININNITNHIQNKQMHTNQQFKSAKSRENNFTSTPLNSQNKEEAKFEYNPSEIQEFFQNRTKVFSNWQNQSNIIKDNSVLQQDNKQSSEIQKLYSANVNKIKKKNSYDLKMKKDESIQPQSKLTESYFNINQDNISSSLYQDTIQYSIDLNNNQYPNSVRLSSNLKSHIKSHDSDHSQILSDQQYIKTQDLLQSKQDNIQQFQNENNIQYLNQNNQMFNKQENKEFIKYDSQFDHQKDSLLNNLEKSLYFEQSKSPISINQQYSQLEGQQFNDSVVISPKLSSYQQKVYTLNKFNNDERNIDNIKKIRLKRPITCKNCQSSLSQSNIFQKTELNISLRQSQKQLNQTQQNMNFKSLQTTQKSEDKNKDNVDSIQNKYDLQSSINVYQIEKPQTCPIKSNRNKSEQKISHSESSQNYSQQVFQQFPNYRLSNGYLKKINLTLVNNKIVCTETNTSSAPQKQNIQHQQLTQNLYFNNGVQNLDKINTIQNKTNYSQYNNTFGSPFNQLFKIKQFQKDQTIENDQLLNLQNLETIQLEPHYQAYKQILQKTHQQVNQQTPKQIPLLPHKQVSQQTPKQVQINKQQNQQENLYQSQQLIQQQHQINQQIPQQTYKLEKKQVRQKASSQEQRVNKLQQKKDDQQINNQNNQRTIDKQITMDDQNQKVSQSRERSQKCKKRTHSENIKSEQNTKQSTSRNQHVKSVQKKSKTIVTKESLQTKTKNPLKQTNNINQLKEENLKKADFFVDIDILNQQIQPWSQIIESELDISLF